MRELRFSTAALHDLASVALESETKWGAAQRTKYMAQIERRLGKLRERPELGPVFGPRRPGLCRLVIGSHVAFYRFDDDQVRIARVLHQRMDVERHL